MTATLATEAALAAAVKYAREAVPAALARLAAIQAEAGHGVADEASEDARRALAERLRAGADMDHLPQHMLEDLNSPREHAEAVAATVAEELRAVGEPDNHGTDTAHVQAQLATADPALATEYARLLAAIDQAHADKDAHLEAEAERERRRLGEARVARERPAREAAEAKVAAMIAGNDHGGEKRQARVHAQERSAAEEPRPAIAGATEGAAEPEPTTTATTPVTGATEGAAEHEPAGNDGDQSNGEATNAARFDPDTGEGDVRHGGRGRGGAVEPDP